jgi:DNA-binding transcriptional regulator YdaS (Cro superfamily)
LCDHPNIMLEQWELRVAITALGGPTAASRRLGCSDALVHHWLTGRRLISAEKALRLRNLMIDLCGTLPVVIQDLRRAEQEADFRRLRWRAKRPRWQPARGDKPPLTPLERSERRR